MVFQPTLSPGHAHENFELKRSPLKWKGAYSGGRYSCCRVAILTAPSYSGRALSLDFGLVHSVRITQRHNKSSVLTGVRGESQQFDSFELAKDM